MKLGVIGAGHVGLVTAATFAERGHDVLCADVDKDKIKALAKGGTPIFEPELPELLAKGLAAGALRFGTSNADVARECEVIFVCVGTPATATGATEVYYMESVARDLAEASPTGEYRLVVDKSTVPVSTAQRMAQTIARYCGAGADIEVASNPEFLRESTAVADTLQPERIVLGVTSDRATQKLLACYDGFPGERIVTDRASAELIKHASNSFLAMKVSYVNMLARICSATGADVEQVAHGMALDSRIGPSFLRAGLGYGGFCLPKDVRAFASIGDEVGVDVALLRAVHTLNEGQVDVVLDSIRDELWVLRGKRVGLWGLSFKPGTDDARGSPAVRLAARLIDEGATVVGYDPQASEHAKRDVPGLTLADSAEAAATGADALVLATEWPEFLAVDAARVHGWLRLPLVFDARNALDHAAYRAAGLTVFGVGRPQPDARRE